MLSYRHGFHAGNHADVLKHFVLVQLLRLLTKKERPLWFVDTHAGAGVYSLEHGFAAKKAEYANGIGRLWSRPDLPAALADYVGEVRRANPDGTLRVYPGSPQLALQLLRAQDRLRLFERHTNESRVLQDHFRSAGRRVSAVAGDGFEGLRAVLPPPSRRALVLVDPSYETASDYRAVPAAIADALARFATGTYAVWYPRLSRREAGELPRKLLRLTRGDWLDVWLDVMRPRSDRLGLHGSGVFVVNPPWQLENLVRAALPTLVAALGQDDGAGCDLQFRQT